MKILNLFNSRTKILTFLLIFIISWIAIVKLVSLFIVSNVDDDWKNIEKEKEQWRQENALQIYNSLQKEISDMSNSLSANYEIRKQTDKGDIKKIYDEIYRNNISSDFQIEVYDKWMNLLAFRGNQLEPEFYLLQKAFDGKSFSIIKEIGFSDYLVVFKPVKNFDDDNQICGVLLTAKLLNVKFQYSNEFYEKTAFS
ncbi:MAG: hypothetical protein WC358_07090, partial [Ignavibacteria bacterium]